MIDPCLPLIKTKPPKPADAFRQTLKLLYERFSKNRTGYVKKHIRFYHFGGSKEIETELIAFFQISH